MNCSNCGAPFHALSQRGVLRCDYCESRRVLTDEGIGLDGVIFLGAPTDVDCPACGDQLVTAIIDDHACQACPSCFGVALEQPTFGSLIGQKRGNYRHADRPAAPLNLEALNHQRECPHCREAMDVHPYYGPGNTVIDSCRDCRLVWLDAGEIAAIETAPGRRAIA
jgi:Zn-finger nucleic acid-binding protein